MDGTAPIPVEASRATDGSDRKLLNMSTLVSWLLFMVWPLSLFFEIPIVIALVIMRSRRWYLAVLLSFTTVISLATILFSSIGYFTGTAEYPWCYLEEAERSSIIGDFSPRYRCNYSTWGSDIGPLPFVYVHYWPQALTIDACVALFGPVKHTYHGPLPTMQDALGWMGSPSCQRVPMAQFTSGSFNVANTAMKLRQESIQAALHCARYGAVIPRYEIDASQAVEVRAVLYKGQCLAVMAEYKTSYGQMGSVSDWIISLIDVAHGSILSQELYWDISDLR